MCTFLENDDFEEIKWVAHHGLFCDVEPIEDSNFVCHPFFLNNIYYDENGNTLDLLDESDLAKARNIMWNAILRANTLDEIIWRIIKPYQLSFLGEIKQYLTKETFSKALGDIWVMVDNPTQDSFVSIDTIIEWFKECDKECLMYEDDDYGVYKNLPNEFEVYRGVTNGKNPNGLSWTRNYEEAKWFANRFGNNGYILKATIKKEDVLAYFNTRNEEEIVVRAIGEKM